MSNQIRLNYHETMDSLCLHIHAGAPVILLRTPEEERAFDCIAKIWRVLRKRFPQKELIRWHEGACELEVWQDNGPLHLQPAQGRDKVDWLAAPGLAGLTRGRSGWQRTKPNLTDQQHILDDIAETQINNRPLFNSIIVLFDMHAQLGGRSGGGQDSRAVRPLRRAADALARHYEQEIAQQADPEFRTIIIVSPTDDVAAELDRDVLKFELPLPEKTELENELQRLIGQGSLFFKQDALEEDQAEITRAIASAGRGLTLRDYVHGLHCIRVTGEALDDDKVTGMLNLKASAISNPALFFTPRVNVQLGGLNNIKRWIDIRKGAMKPEVRSAYRLESPRGVFLAGVPGGGKSKLAEHIATTFAVALLRLDVGALFGSFVGESEQRCREALVMAEMLSPVVLWLDEVEKAFSGMQDGNDGGVASRVFGTFLTWLGDHKSEIFVVATANDQEAILSKFPEFGRRGRFDDLFWVGAPDEEGLREIFKLYMKDICGPDNLARQSLMVTSAELEHWERLKSIRNASGSDFERICAILAKIGNGLTGAEVKGAVEEAKAEAFSLDQADSAPAYNKLTLELLAEVVKRAHERRVSKHNKPPPDGFLPT